MSLTAGSMAEGRQTWCWSNNSELALLFESRRQREREMTENGRALKTLKPYPYCYASSYKAMPPKLSPTVPPGRDQAFKYRSLSGLFPSKPPQIIRICNWSNYEEKGKQTRRRNQAWVFLGCWKRLKEPEDGERGIQRSTWWNRVWL